MKPQGKKRIRALLFFCVLLVVVLLLLEGFTSLVAKRIINTQEVDPGLFQARGVGENCFGLTPGGEGWVYGTVVRINSEGYRGTVVVDSSSSKILFLGDDVLFGVGVPYDRIFSTLVSKNTGKSVINTGVPGYSTNSLLKVLEHWLNKTRFETVCILLTLDDVIRAGDHVVFPSFFRSPFKAATAWLRSHSRLYMIAKSILCDRQRAYFEEHSKLYSDENPGFRRAVGDLRTMTKICSDEGVFMKLFLLPYEYQLRRLEDPAVWTPQRMVKMSLAPSGMEIHDLKTAFNTTQVSSKDYYLFEDAMHLSIKGHEAVARELCRILSSNQ